MSLPALTNPCSPWTTTASLCSPCDDYSTDAGLMSDMLDLASEILYYASGQQFNGLCEETIRPCSGSSGTGIPYRMTAFTPITGSFNGRTSICTCASYDTCGCPPLQQVLLPRYPVNDVTEVKIDGTALTSTQYRLDPDAYLVLLGDLRVDCCQNLELADTEDGTWSVTYEWGREPPLALQHAAAVLACELYQSCNPEGFETECRLPRNIASLARQGVAMAFQLIDELFTPRSGKPISFGIPEIDMALAVHNPHGNTAPMVFLSPDEADLGRIVGT